MTRDRTHDMGAQIMMQLETHFIVFYSFQTVYSCCLSLPFPPLEKINLRNPRVNLFWSRIDADVSLSYPSSPVPSTLSSVFCSTPLLAMHASVAKPSSGFCLPYVDVYVCTITHSCIKRLIDVLGMNHATTRLSHAQRMSLVLYAARRVLNLNHCTHTLMNDLWLCVCVCVCVWNATGNDLGDVWETDLTHLCQCGVETCQCFAFLSLDLSPRQRVIWKGSIQFKCAFFFNCESNVASESPT